MPQATFTINGDIKDFTRLDNLYVSLKRETVKLLEKWNIDVNVVYSETEATQPEE